ncbi:D-alanyl-D-alanine carboxypeptidase family protein [Sandaracinobacteroides sp. A072]|uniref:D-alanyl-D-alanine carboxypeptidase family protein n=1 Tax=Sandaracinobacteroides sp. A072 TaxID=3461146 RepID=UPI0040410F0F
MAKIFGHFFRCMGVSASLFVASGLLAVAPVQASSLFEQPKYAAFLADAETGEVLYSRHADAQRFPASITKVMTLYMVFERLAAGTLKLDDRVVFSENAARQQPSKLGLKPGESLTVDQAIRSLATKSANDVSVALAEHVAGSVPEFGRLMTARAKTLGMSNSHFVNPHGLPDARQVTSARDIFILSRAMIQHFPQYYQYFQQQQFAFGNQVLRNHNHLLRTMPGVDGIKTGFTRAAGFTLAASAVRDGRRLIAVVLGGPSRVARDSNVETLLSSGFTVLAARDTGRRIQVADMLAEPGDLNDGILEALVEQGSAEQGSAEQGSAEGGPVPRR